MVEKDDDSTVGRVAVPAKEQEFIALDGPAEIFIRPVNTRADHQGYPTLEEGDWGIGFLRIAKSGGISALVEVYEILRTGGVVDDPNAVQPAPTEHLVFSKTLIDPTDPILHIFYDWTTGQYSFKSEVKIVVAGTGLYRLRLQLLPAQYIKRVF